MPLLLSGKEKLDHSVTAGDRFFVIWKESEERLISMFRDDVMDIHLFIKECRFRLGFSKNEIATLIGVSSRAYSNYENGRTRIAAEDLLRLIVLSGYDGIL